MPFPLGLPTKTLTFGRYSSPLGTNRAGQVKIGFDLPMLHTPTGDVIAAGLDSVPINPATGMAQVEVPVTVTPNLLTIPANLENQRLRIAVEVTGYPTAHHFLDIHPDDPAVMDFDQLVPYSSAGGIPVLRASVVSVAGLTDVVGAEELAASLAPFLGGGGGGGGASVAVAGTAATALSGHRVVTRLGDGTLGYASNDDADHKHLPLWVTLGAAASGATAQAIAYGEVTEPSWGWTPGPVFLGAGGALTQNVPQSPTALFLAQVGTATGATRLFVDRQPSITLA